MKEAQQHTFHLKHLLAIDYGQRFTGVATHKVGIEPMIIPWGRIAYQSDEQLINEILGLVEEEFIDAIIVGVPYFTDGTASTMTQTVLAFVQQLKNKSRAPVYLQDETLSTVEAEERMQNDPRYNFQIDYTKIDAVAATIILEDFLALHSQARHNDNDNDKK